MTPMKMRFLSVSVLISAHPWSPFFRLFRDFCFYWFRPQAGLGYPWFLRTLVPAEGRAGKSVVFISSDYRVSSVFYKLIFNLATSR